MSEPESDPYLSPRTVSGSARPDPGEVAGTTAVALFSLGMTAGMLLLLIGFTLIPEPVNEATAEFEAVSAFAASHFVRELSPTELSERALHGMLDGLDDYSRYHDRGDAERARREIDGDFRGIGVVFKPPTSDAQILFPVEGSPAAKAGVRVGDRFVEINGEPTTGLTGAQVREQLAPKGRQSITVRAAGLDGEIRDLVIEPKQLVDPTVRHTVMLDGEPNIGYLAVRSFTNNTADEFDRAVLVLKEQGAQAVILDFRFNYGGVLDAAVHMAGRFLDEGVIVSSEGRVHNDVHSADNIDALFKDLGVVVLVNGDSASASEVFAGALQDHRAAVVVGEATFGKGMLQTTRSFPAFGSRAKVTSAYFYSPSHRNFERSSDPDRDYGILPDLTVAIDEAQRRSLHVWVARYDPPESAIPDLLEWEASSDDSILAEPPPDPQLDAAIAILRGESPGPRLAESR